MRGRDTAGSSRESGDWGAQGCVGVAGRSSEAAELCAFPGFPSEYLGTRKNHGGRLVLLSLLQRSTHSVLAPSLPALTCADDPQSLGTAFFLWQCKHLGPLPPLLKLIHHLT